ncbi:MAG: response regulator [Deltaproteobacteria bacterium]
MVRVLIADDTQFMRANLKIILERNNMQIVGEAENGIKAVKMYDELKPDVVTMDITMPGMDGIEAVRQIRKDYPEAKIVMVTALGQEMFVREAVMAGAKNFIVKPFKEEKIVEILNKVVTTK